MFDKIKTYKNHPALHQLRDVQSLGLIGFAIVAVLVTWSGMQAIQSNYKLEQQLENLRQQNSVQALQNSNQKLKNQYYNTPQYLELAARQNFGLALPGEKELIVPKEVALSHVKDVVVAGSAADTAVRDSAAKKKLPFYQRNVQAWMNFFLHRTNE